MAAAGVVDLVDPNLFDGTRLGPAFAVHRGPGDAGQVAGPTGPISVLKDTNRIAAGNWRSSSMRKRTLAPSTLVPSQTFRRVRTVPQAELPGNKEAKP